MSVKANDTNAPISDSTNIKPINKPRECALNLRQEKFVEELIKNGYNVTQAYKDAGYKWKNEQTAGVAGYRLFNLPKIKRLINQRKAEVTAHLHDITHINREWVLNNLVSAYMMASSKDVIKAEGKTFTLYQPQAAARMLELIGKEVAGMFGDKVEVTNKDVWAQRMEQIKALKAEIAKEQATQTPN